MTRVLVVHHDVDVADIEVDDLRRAGYDEEFISEVARVMEYSKAYELYREDLEF